MPLSTSSKIKVGVVVAFEVITEIASEMRASSPPEATLAKERGATPAWPATRNSTCSNP
jgi:hypothetical protein